MFNIMSENSQTQSAWKKVKQVGGGYYWENETTGEKKYGSESPSEREKAIPINKVLNRLIDKCNKTKMAEEDYMRKITPIIENLEQTGQ